MLKRMADKVEVGALRTSQTTDPATPWRLPLHRTWRLPDLSVEGMALRFACTDRFTGTLMIPAALAVPGDITTVTGGYIYDLRLLEELRLAGRGMHLIRLADSFPFPSMAEMADALAQLQDIPANCPVIIDGLAFGALDTAGVAAMRAPIVALVHHPLALESGLPETQRAHLFETERNNLHHASQVLVPSPHTSAILAERYQVPADRIHIAKPGRAQPKVDSIIKPCAQTPPLILSVGILHHRKGHDVLIDALAQIADLGWSAIIVGNPWEKGQPLALQQQIDRLGLGKRIRLAGSVSSERLTRLYEQATLFALATRYEGYGIVFNEALVHGLPIVSCSTGAVPDTVPAEAGMLVPRDDPAAFATALRDILADMTKQVAMSRAAASFGLQLPDWAETARIAGAAIDLAAVPAA
jgi:glycosyltransferase involved in cell wall biosynthesis